MPDTGSYKAWMYRYRKYLISVGTIAVLIALIIALTPFGIQYAMVAWLEGDNDRSVNIKNVDFNPFTGELFVEGLKVEEPNGRRLELPHVFLDLELSALFKKRIHLRTLDLRAGFLEVEQKTDSALRLAGLPAPTKPQEPMEEPSGWQVGANSIVMERLQIRFHGLRSQETIALQKLQIANIAQWQSDSPAQIDTALTLGDAIITATGSAIVFSETQSVDVKLKTKSLDMALFNKFSGGAPLKGISGSVTADLDIQGKIQNQQKIALSLTGSLRGDKLSALIAETVRTPRQQTGKTTGVEATLRPESRISLGQVRIADLNAKLSLNQGLPETIELTSDTRIEGLGIDTGHFKLKNKSLQWAGKIAGSMGASATSHLRATGNFESTASELRFGSETDQVLASFSIGRILVSNLVSDIKRSRVGDINAEMTAEAVLQKLVGDAAGSMLRNEEIGWKGQIGTTIDAAGKMAIRAVGEFDSRLLQVDLPGAGLKVSQESANWKGQIAYRQEEALAKPKLSLDGVAQTAGIRVDSPDLGLRLLSLGSLVVDDVTVKGTEDIYVRQVVMRALETVQQLPSGPKKTNESEPYAVVRGALTANDVTVVDGSQVRIKEVLLQGASGQIERLENGELRVVGSLLKLIGELGAKQDKRQDQRESKPIRVQIDEWNVKGSSRLLLVDRSVKPPTRFAITPIEVHVKNIDSGKPEGSTPIEIVATLGKYSKLDFKGSTKPFSRRLNLDVVGKLSALDLTALSSYSSEYMGYDLTRGRMDTELHISVVKGKLQAESKLIISKLQVEPSDPKLLDPLKKRLQIPLETGLSLLRDSEDVIRLSIPVTGDITSPKFDFSDAINTAIGNAMKKTILTTLKIAFPLGGIIMTMAESGGEAKLQLNPVPFAAASAELSTSAKANLSKVAELLRSRPAVKISICGWATPKDKVFLVDRDFVKAKAIAQKTKSIEQQAGQVTKDPKAALANATLRDKITNAVLAKLPELGKRRGEAVKDHLIKQFSVPEARLFLCAPKVSKEANAMPRVEIFL